MGCGPGVSLFELLLPLATESMKDFRSSRATSMSRSCGGGEAGCGPTGLRCELKGSLSWYAAGLSGLTTGDKMRTFFCTFGFVLAAHVCLQHYAGQPATASRS